ncbi:cytochrome P450 4C1-like isoform X3 [Temnothorax nylanderi]|uniref:cytochrome P450 4C1-like isoform X3 n=1 Tax=Temnothorax nylanderi TaxID=102681 RepID=UPI003A84409C
MITIILLLLILILLISNYYVHYHGKKKRLINLIPGPSGYPIVGNAFQYLGSRKEQWKFLISLTDEFYPIGKVWGFFFPIISIRHPNDLETILSSTKHIEKSLLYDVLHPWFSNGLLTSGGAKWHSRRKILTPTFHFNILQQFIQILIEEETAMGTSLRGLGDFQQQYREAVHRMGELLIYRAFRQWLRSDWIFSLTSKGREQKKMLKILHGFTKRIIAERKVYHDRTNGQYLKNFDNDTSAKRDDAEPVRVRRKRLAMLDLLIAASRDGLMTDSDIREEVDTFMFEGHDTTAMGLCFISALLAEHKDIQDRVRNEVNTALQKNEQKFTMKLLQDLPYLDRCIKEALRLYPSVFAISRIAGEDVKLQSYLVPAGTSLHLNIYGVHRDPNFWSNPEVFEPDRFLPEKIRHRHPYSYLPFSAGPRNCIGQRFAILEMKAMIAPLVHNFYLKPIDYLKNLRPKLDLVIRVDQLRVKFIPIGKMNLRL